MLYIQKYLKHLESSFRSKSNIYRNRWILKKTKKYFSDLNIHDEKKITEKNIIDYLAYLKQTSTDSVLYLVTVHLKLYFKYLEDHELIFISPMINIDLPKEPRKYTPVIDYEEIQEAFNKIDTSTDEGLRSRAMLELLYSSALRRAELTGIKLIDIDFKKKTLFIEQGKNSKDRIVPVGEVALSWIEKYIKEVRYKYLCEPGYNYLFTSFKYGKKMTSTGVYQAITRTFERNNIKSFRLHSLRTSAASHMLVNGMGIFHIQKLLGHDRLSTTQIYLRLKIYELKKIMQEHHPANNIGAKPQYLGSEAENKRRLNYEI